MFEAFGEHDLTRDEQARASDAWLRDAVRHPAARFLPLLDSRPPLAADGGLCWVGRDRLRHAPGDELVVLGLDGGEPRIALEAGGRDAVDLPPGARFADTRAALAALSPPDNALLAEALELLAWHRAARFCGSCGQPTAPAYGGYRRNCGGCGTELFARVDPVAIMLVVKGARCVLARAPRYGPRRYSCIAGHTHPGESIEHTVRRETREEIGIAVGAVEYQGSQTWPFAHKLMLGFVAQALSERIAVDREELEDARWFELEEVRAALSGASATLELPPPFTIAHQLIKGWAGRTAAG